MEAASEIKLYEEALVLRNNTLFFEDNIIYDFEDRYHNISIYGVEQQLQTFLNLVKMIYETSMPKAVKAENVMIFANIFRILSARNISSDFVCIGENAFHELFAYVLSLFGNENKLIMVPIQDTGDLKKLQESNYALVLVNLDTIQGNIDEVLMECYRIASKKSRIFCYASGEFNLDLSGINFAETADLFQLGSESYLLSIDISDKKPDAGMREDKERFLERITPMKSELFSNLEYIVSNRPEAGRKEWHGRMEEAIRLTSQLETIIAENYFLLDHENAKYLTNEVKNALLDLKFEAYPGRKHYDFFHSALTECVCTWTDCLF